MSEDERARAAREHELRNEETVLRILVSGSDSEMKEIQELNSFTDEQMEAMRYWARVRDGVVGNRPRIDREKTDEEKELGVYVDNIEPQVLEAVRTFRAKGYKTYYSGFGHLGSAQTIWFNKDQSTLIPFPDAIKLAVEEQYGVKIKIEPGRIWIDCLEARLTTEDLKQIWDTIAEALPPYQEQVVSHGDS